MRSRLILLAHARALGSAAGGVRFPAAGDRLDEKALAATRRLAARLLPPRFDRVLASPADAARQTADALGLAAEIEPALGDQRFGAWAGRTLDEVGRSEPDAVAAWIAGASGAPDGEAFAAVMRRVGRWLDAAASGAPGRTLAVSHQAVLRAAVLHVLGAPAEMAARIDAAPATLAEFSGDGRRWTLRRVHPLDDEEP